MRNKIKEIRCRDEHAHEVTIIQWCYAAATGNKPDPATVEYKLEDGSPVLSVGGKFEHFYSGRMFSPI
jgi:hypothetical protein